MDTKINVFAEDGLLTIRQGQALPLKEPVAIEIDGDIKSVSAFLNVRKAAGTGYQEIDISKAVITVDKKAMSICLETDPGNAFGTTVTGKLEISEELKNFSINQNQTFRKEELVKLIKFNKLFFADAEKHAAMLLAFQKVSSTVNIRAGESSDERGNKERSFVKEVTTNAPTEFILQIPVFKNFANSRFRVEICLDVTEGSARFWFESVELHEIMQQQMAEIFATELESADGFVVINK